MRTIAMILAAILVAKVAIQEYVWRAATEEVLITAYAEQAVDACRSQIRAHAGGAAGAAIEPRELKFGIGNPTADVALWDVNHRDWTKRFRTAYLRLSFDHGPRRIRCHFDLMQRHAEVLG